MTITQLCFDAGPLAHSVKLTRIETLDTHICVCKPNEVLEELTPPGHSATISASFNVNAFTRHSNRNLKKPLPSNTNNTTTM